MDSNTLAVVNFDNTLVKLNINDDKVRQHIINEFSPLGIDNSFEPLVQNIEEVCSQIKKRDATLAARMHQRAWDIIDAAELEGSRHARLLPNTDAFLQSLGTVPIAIYSSNLENAVKQALAHVGLAERNFLCVQARKHAGPFMPSTKPLLAILEQADRPLSHIHIIGDHPHDMRAAKLLEAELRSKKHDTRVSAIALRSPSFSDRNLEESGATYLAHSLDEAASFITTPKIKHSLSVVVMAYNEQESIRKSIQEIRRFCREYIENYEIIVVDDGSSDNTTVFAQQIDEGDLRFEKHVTNRGMGATMKTGYDAATMDFVVSLPADCQLRGQSLIRFLPYLHENQTVVSYYLAPPSGLKRKWMSKAFRLLLHYMGGLTINLEGAYIFPRHFWTNLNRRLVPSDTFVFSFELLQAFAKKGGLFKTVYISPFYREVGHSRVDTPWRIFRVFTEILKSRLKRLFVK